VGDRVRGLLAGGPRSRAGVDLDQRGRGLGGVDALAEGLTFAVGEGVLFVGTPFVGVTSAPAPEAGGSPTVTVTVIEATSAAYPAIMLTRYVLVHVVASLGPRSAVWRSAWQSLVIDRDCEMSPRGCRQDCHDRDHSGRPNSPTKARPTGSCVVGLATFASSHVVVLALVSSDCPFTFSSSLR
jgi:hypothetical protein